ncbi:MAG TPA: GAF domain-containing protein [Terriglobales bacterium]
MNSPNLPESNSSFSERRHRPRHKIQTPAYARISGEPKGFLLDLNTILDLSEEGMCIQVPAALGVDHVLDLCLELAEAAGPIYTAGKVVWSNRLGRAGIRFGPLSEASTQQLKRWLFLNAISGVADSKSADSKSADPKFASESEEHALPQPAALAFRDSIESLETSDNPPNSADHTSLLAGLSAVRREVEALGTNLRAVLELVTDRAFMFSHASGAAIALSNDIDIICLARAGADAPSVGARVSTESGLSAECVRTGELLYCEDSENDSRVDRDACRSLGIRSIVAVPIYDQEKIAGLLEVFSREPASFGFHANLILQNLAGMVGYALESISMEIGTVQRTKAAETAEDVNMMSTILPQQAGIPQPEQEEFSDVSKTVFASDFVGSGDLDRKEEVADVEVTEWHAWFRRALFVVALLTVITAVLWVFLSRKGSQTETSTHPVSTVANPVSGMAAPLDQQRKLAEQGDAAVQFAIGARYATGDEVKQNYTEAARWFSMAAAQGNISAQATLAAYYFSGTGVPKDASKAYFWALLAQAGGDEASKYRVSILASRMSHSQLVAVQEQANQWLKNHQVAKSH